jgi:hypothetical protein
VTGTRVRFDGWIAGLGTTSGTRLVLGHWTRSPFGPVTDVMVEGADGHRRLLAGDAELGRFVAETYSFDDARVVPTDAQHAGPRWAVTAGPLNLRFTTGGRGALGRLLHLVPRPLARCRPWVRFIDWPARLILPGVRTYGSAGHGRREWYAVQDLHRITAATAELDGTSLGDLADIHPPVRFGFGSTPRFPALVRVTTTVQMPT